MASTLNKAFTLLTITAAVTLLLIIYTLHTNLYSLTLAKLVLNDITPSTRELTAAIRTVPSSIITPQAAVSDTTGSLCVPVVRLLFLPSGWINAPDSGYTRQDCDVPCMYSKDTHSTTAVKQADAVVVYLPTYPGHPSKLLHKYRLDTNNVFTVGMTMESVRTHPHQFDHITHYNVEMSYRMSSDVPNPYFTFARGKQNLLEATHSHWASREKAVLFVARNCQSTSHREDLLRALQAHVRVDSVSDCLHNKDWPSDIPRTDKRGLLRRYVALLAAENSVEDDYVTEKVYAGLIAGAVPIYYGAQNIDQFVPSNSIIKVPYPFNNATILEVAGKIQDLLNNESNYNRLTSFKRLNNYDNNFLKTFNFTRIDVKCRLCHKIMSLKCN